MLLLPLLSILHAATAVSYSHDGPEVVRPIMDLQELLKNFEEDDHVRAWMKSNSRERVARQVWFPVYVHTASVIFPSTDLKKTSLPTPIQQVLTDATSNKEYDFSSTCKLTATPSEGKVTVAVKSGGCSEKPSLKTILTQLLPDSKVEAGSSHFICPDCYYFESLVVDKNAKIMEMVVTGKETIRLMNPVYLEVDNAKLTFSYDLGEMDLDLSKMVIEMEGTGKLKHRSAPIRITKPHGSSKFSFTLKLSNIMLRDLFGHFGIVIIELSVPEVGFTTQPFMSMRIKDPTVLGSFSIDPSVEENVATTSTLQIVSKFEVQNSGAFVRATIYVLIDKKPGLPPTGAILAAVPQNFNMLDQLKKFLTMPNFNKQLPMLRKIKRRYLICVSQDEIAVVEDETMLELLKPYIKGDDANLIPQGASVKIFLPVKENMKECSPPVKLSEMPDEIPVNIFLKKRGLDFTYPDKFRADMPSMLKCLDMQIAAEIPYQLFPKKDGLISIKEFTFGIGRSFRVFAAVNGPFVLARGLLNISDIDVIVENKLDSETEEWEWTFTGSTTITLKNLTVDISIEKSGGEYTVMGSVESFFLSDLKEITGDNLFFKLIELFGPLKNFGIKDFSIVATMGDAKVLRVAGQPILFGRNDLHMEAIIYKDEDTTAIILGILFRQVDLSKLVEELTGLSLLKSGWFSEVTAYILISNVESEEAISMPEMEEQGVEKGVMISASFRLPEECHGDSLCEFMATKLGRDVTISLEGQVQKNDGSWLFKLAAGISGAFVLIPERLTLKSVSLALTIDGMDSNVELACEMDYENPQANIDTLTFTGAISLSLSGELSLSFTMMGMWLKPFGFEYLGFGNLILGIGYQIGAGFPSFEFGGELWIGKIESGENATNDHLFKVSCYFGLDPGDPTNNYIYTNINKLTIGSLFEAFKIETEMPQVVADTGFPEGLIVSFTSNPDGREIEALDIKVEFGFYMKGTINILGYTVTGEIIISDDVMQFDISMAPLILAGGLITISKSKDDQENGPKCFVKIDEEAVIVQIEGYIHFLSTAVEVVIDVSDTGFKFNVTAEIYGIITANVYVEAAYGSMQTAAFRFRASLMMSFKQIAEEVKKFLDKIAEDAKKALERAQKALDHAKKKIEQAKAKVDGWKGEISAFRERNNRRIVELEQQKKAMNEDCKKKCGTVCVPFLDWNPHCFKFFWYWCGCPAWNSCKWKAPNLLCIAGCETNKFFRKVGATIEQIGLTVVNALSHVGDVVLDVGKGVLDIGSKCVDGAKLILSGVTTIVQVGINIAKEVVSVLLEKLLEIRHLELSGSFDSDLNACLGMACDISLLGLEIRMNSSICVNLNFLKVLSGKLTEKKYPGVKNMYTELDKKEADYEDLNKTESDMDKQVKEGEEELETEVRKPSKRAEIPGLWPERPAGYNPFPEWVMKRADIMHIFRTQAPWVLPDTIDQDLSFSFPTEDKEMAYKRTLEASEINSPNHCVRLRSAIEKFGDIINAFYEFTTSLRDQKDQMNLYDQHVVGRLDGLNQHISSMGSMYNISHEEKEDAYYWHDLMKKGHDEWNMKAHNILNHQQKNKLASLRSSIDYVLLKSKGTKLEDYVGDLEQRAMDAYRRSNLFAEGKSDAAKIRRLRKILLKVFDDKEDKHGWLHRDIAILKGDLRTLREHSKHCRHHHE